MFKKSLLIVCLLTIISSLAMAQKKNRQLSIADQIQILLDQPAKKKTVLSGDLLITFFDSSGIHRVDKLTSSNRTQSVDNQLFELGDLSHIFTSLLVHELASLGRIKTDISINNLLPDDYQSEYFQNITLQDCLSHTTGLPRLPNNLGIRQIDHNQPYENYRSEDLADYIQAWTPIDESKKYLYSQVGYVIVGFILEYRFQRSFDELVQEVIIPVHGLPSMTASNTSQLEPGRNKIGQAVPPMRFSAFESAAGLKANRVDLEHWILQILERPNHAFQKSLAIHASTGIDASTSIASGWHHYQVNKLHAFYMQKGSTNGYASFIAIHPETKTAVLMLASQKTNLGPLGYHILGLLNNSWNKVRF